MSWKIMMVDDEPSVVRIYSVLSEMEGISVLKALDGAAALKILETETPDAFVLDVMMPDMDGFELCQEIRSRPETADKPVIFLSARADLAIQEEAREAGGNAYLVKPIRPEELLNLVKESLGMPASEV